MINLLMPDISFAEWERCITDSLIELLEITNSDAQGMIEANPFIMAQSWCNGLMPDEVAYLIINK